MRRTGGIWKRSPRSRGQVVRHVCENLDGEYGRPRHGNPKDPLDDLVYVLLSNQTPPERARSIYRQLKDRFSSWRGLLGADQEDVYELIKPAGFGRRRTSQLRSIFKTLREDFGEVEADELWRWPDERLLDYLTSLRGVSGKVARCVMMYASGREVLPVDVHVHRVAVRLGWTSRSRPEQCHEELEVLLPRHRYYAFHVDCISHGRTLCTSSEPSCRSCPVRRYCSYADGPMAPPG